jgi:hypothetical protein
MEGILYCSSVEFDGETPPLAIERFATVCFNARSPYQKMSLFSTEPFSYVKCAKYFDGLKYTVIFLGG